MGCATWFAATVAALEGGLAAARDDPRPAVIACEVEPLRMLLDSGAWWDVGFEDDEGAARQRWLG